MGSLIALARPRGTRHARRRWGQPLLLIALVGSLSACIGSGEGEKSWEEVRAERVKDFMLHLNNASETERHRDGLIDVGQRSTEDREFVVRECTAAYEESMQRGGVGTGVLRVPGRRRVMEVVAALGDYPPGRSLLKLGLRDDDPVALAAAAGLVSLGDGAAVPTLFEAVLALPAGDPEQKKGLQSLRRAAKPKLRGDYLNALGAGNLEVVEPVVLATFPNDKEKRIEALRKVVEEHPNPYARRFALGVLIEEEDPGAIPLARAALDKDDRVVRPVALKALGAVGGNKAAQEIEEVLRTDPTDARAVVRGLYEVGTQEALERALNLLGDDELKPHTRAAVATEFMARMKDEDAPGAYRKREALAEALASLREVIAGGIDTVVIAAVEALGRIGDRDADVEPLLGLLQDPSPKIAPTVVGALGRLGGEFAAAKLVELIGSDPGLRKPALEALKTFKNARDIPVDDLIDLLEDENESTRLAALQALQTLRRSKDKLGYDPRGNEDERTKGANAWRHWWRKRRGG